jgi:HEAT repeat protein
MTTKNWFAFSTNDHVGTAAARMLAASLILIAAFGSVTAIAQTCGNWSPEQLATSIAQIQTSCEHNEMPYTADVLALASIGDEQAIPALHKLADWPTDKDGGAVCQGWVNAARLALAKLGDDDYRAGRQMRDVAFIGDDRALTELIEFLIAHAKDPTMYQDFGDYGYDIRDAIISDIDTIRRRRLVPDLPVADYSDSGVAQWKAYLEKHKGQQMTFPAYAEAIDPYLTCLARRVDWGFPDAILAIAARGGNSARQLLQLFPNSGKPEAMGFAVSSPFGDRRKSIQGNLQVALAQLGDDEMFEQIVAALNSGAAYGSVRKLEFIGGKRAVDALVKALDISEEAVQKARRIECGPWTYCYPNEQAYKPIWGTVPYRSQIDLETCETETFHKCLTGVLSFMVKDPPLQPGADATPENIQKWKDWWAKNKDHAEFVVRPAQSFE